MRLLEREFVNLITSSPAPGVVKVLLNRPEQRNAVTEEMHRELLELAALINDEPNIGAVILSGVGKGFCSGGDFELINAHREKGSDWSIRTMDDGIRLVIDFLSIRPPVVVAVNGHAMGLGATLALIGDHVIMAESALIGDTHVKVGLVAGDGGSLLWPALVGPLRAKEALMSGNPITANRALQIGLVSAVTTLADLDNAALEKAVELANGPRPAIAWTKRLINSEVLARAAEHLALALSLEARSMALPDFAEGIDAIVHKRRPNWPSAVATGTTSD